MPNSLKTLCAAAFVSLLMVPITAAQTPSKAVPTVAGILLKLNHFASDPEKATLKQIVDDKAATDYEKTVAQALIGVQHTVNAADKPKLEALVKDPKAPEGVKTIASALLSVTHMATEADKEKLKKLVP
jgi:hypothetical protein